MSKKIRKKKCYFCNNEFEYKSIRAKYCSDSCRNNAYRRSVDPSMYDCDYPIHFELPQEEYEYLLHKADDYEMDPSEFIKSIVTKRILTGSTVVFLSEPNKEIIQIVFDKKGYKGSFEKALSDWVIETSEEQQRKF